MVVLKIHYQILIDPRSPIMPRFFLQNEYFSSYGQKTPFFEFLGGQIPILSKLTPYFDSALGNVIAYMLIWKNLNLVHEKMGIWPLKLLGSPGREVYPEALCIMQIYQFPPDSPKRRLNLLRGIEHRLLQRFVTPTLSLTPSSERVCARARK